MDALPLCHEPRSSTKSSKHSPHRYTYTSINAGVSTLSPRGKNPDCIGKMKDEWQLPVILITIIKSWKCGTRMECGILCWTGMHPKPVRPVHVQSTHVQPDAAEDWVSHDARPRLTTHDRFDYAWPGIRAEEETLSRLAGEPAPPRCTSNIRTYQTWPTPRFIVGVSSAWKCTIECAG